MQFIHYPKCSTCRKAKSFLDENGKEYIERDITKEVPTYEELKKFVEKSGLPIKRFFNTSGMPYRDLGLKDKLETMSDEEKLELLASDGMLIKRPILETDSTVLVGFKEDQWKMI